MKFHDSSSCLPTDSTKPIKSTTSESEPTIPKRMHAYPSTLSPTPFKRSNSCIGHASLNKRYNSYRGRRLHPYYVIVALFVDSNDSIRLYLRSRDCCETNLPGYTEHLRGPPSPATRPILNRLNLSTNC